jgi:hypothetical protein
LEELPVGPTSSPILCDDKCLAISLQPLKRPLRWQRAHASASAKAGQVG